jgi:translocation and assembly module TamA
MAARTAPAPALLLFVLFLLVSAPAFAQAPVRYQLRVEAPREVRELLAGRLPLERWQDDAQMSEALLLRLMAEAEAEVREAVATRGYFSARVATRLDRAAEPWTVVLEVDPGAPARVSEVDIAYSGPAASDPDAPPLLQRIRREWRLRPGERFTQEGWNDAKRSAARALAAWRYPAAHIGRSQARIDPKAGEARLAVDIDSGPAFRFGEVEVRGTDRYPDDLVARLSPAEPGALYERDTLDLYERRLLATGYFVSAQAAVPAEPESAARAPVRVAVVEGRSQHFETGLSFNTDVGPRLEARYRNLDVFDTAHRLRSEVQLDQRIRQGRLDLDAPPRRGGRWNGAFVQARDTIIQNEENVELSGGVAHNWGLGGPPSSIFVSGHLEEQRISGQLADNRHAVFFGYRTQWRDTDSWELPRRGSIFDLSIGGAPGALASRGFTRATGRALLFFPVGRHDLLLRGEAGVVVADTRQGIPSSFLFRTGGDQTVRGYAFESLGVRLDNVVLGGRYLAVGSAEYTHWVGESWGIAGFVDAGDAWDEGKFDPAVGAGLGARFRTPVGPVRGDLAYGFAERQWRLHFSVGFVF